MKRLYTLLTVVLFSGAVFGQCVPDPTITVPGYYPDSLPYAVVGVPYTTDIQVLVPATYSGFSIDSVRLDSISGLPAGFTYSCNPTTCRFMPLVNACLQITGPAFSASAAGNVYPLTMHLRAFVHLGPFPIDTAQSVTQFAIVVDQASGLQTLSKTRFDVSEVSPNPITDQSLLAYSLPAAAGVTVKISNLLGSVLSTRHISSSAGRNTITLNARDYKPGIYIVSLSDGKSTLTRRMVVKNQ